MFDRVYKAQLRSDLLRHCAEKIVSFVALAAGDEEAAWRRNRSGFCQAFISCCTGRVFLFINTEAFAVWHSGGRVLALDVDVCLGFFILARRTQIKAKCIFLFFIHESHDRCKDED